MCLITKTPKVQVAEEDIVCYKVLKRLDEKNRYATPYMRARLTVTPDSVQHPDSDVYPIYEATKEQPGNLPTVLFDAVCLGYINPYRINDTYLLYVEDGFIHTYRDVACKSAEITINQVTISSVASVCECIIPKGTEYVEGVTPHGSIGYASRSIVYKKELFTKTESNFPNWLKFAMR